MYQYLGASGWLLSVLTIALLFQSAQAQQNTFQWGPGITANTLQECGNVKLQVTAKNSQPLNPPWYMVAYEPSGPTSTSLLGSDPNNLAWTVDHSAGKQVILQVIDSKGNSGGVSPSPYPINAGPSNNCHNAPNPSIQLTVTQQTLKTCDPFVLDISGGKQPYSITIAAANSAVVTNATLGPNDNEYTYINRIPPGSQFIAVALDATGQYSTSTNLITTSGPTDTSCKNAQSQSGVKGGSSSSSSATPTKTGKGGHTKTAESTSSASGSASASAAPAKHSSSGAIAGGVIGGLVAAAAIAGAAFFICRRRAQRNSGHGWNGGYGPSPAQVTPFKVEDQSFNNRPTQQPDPGPGYPQPTQELYAGGATFPMPPTNLPGSGPPTPHPPFSPYRDLPSTPASVSNFTDASSVALLSPHQSESVSDLPAAARATSPPSVPQSQNLYPPAPQRRVIPPPLRVQSPIQSPASPPPSSGSNTYYNNAARNQIPMTVEPASVMYARGLAASPVPSAATPPFQPRPLPAEPHQEPPQQPQPQPQRQYTSSVAAASRLSGYDEEDTELAYRLSVASGDMPNPYDEAHNEASMPPPPAYVQGGHSGYPVDRKN